MTELFVDIMHYAVVLDPPQDIAKESIATQHSSTTVVAPTQFSHPQSESPAAVTVLRLTSQRWQPFATTTAPSTRALCCMLRFSLFSGRPNNAKSHRASSEEL